MNIWDALQSALDDVPKSRPENSVTALEFAERSGVSHSTAIRKLESMTKAGLLRAVWYKTSTGTPAKCYLVAE